MLNYRLIDKREIEIKFIIDIGYVNHCPCPLIKYVLASDSLYNIEFAIIYEISLIFLDIGYQINNLDKSFIILSQFNIYELH